MALLGMVCGVLFRLIFITNFSYRVVNSRPLTNDLLPGLLKPQSPEIDVGALKLL